MDAGAGRETVPRFLCGVREAVQIAVRKEAGESALGGRIGGWRGGIYNKHGGECAGLSGVFQTSCCCARKSRDECVVDVGVHIGERRGEL